MSCCGGKRTDLQRTLLNHAGTERTASDAPLSRQVPRVSPGAAPAAQLAGTIPPVAAPTRSPPLPAAVTLRYLAGAPILVRGAASHAEYRFTRDTPLQRVAPADAAALLASGYFRRES